MNRDKAGCSGLHRHPAPPSILDSILLFAPLLEDFHPSHLPSSSEAPPDPGYREDMARGGISCSWVAQWEHGVSVGFLYEDIDPSSWQPLGLMPQVSGVVGLGLHRHSSASSASNFSQVGLFQQPLNNPETKQHQEKLCRIYDCKNAKHTDLYYI